MLQENKHYTNCRHEELATTVSQLCWVIFGVLGREKGRIEFNEWRRKAALLVGALARAYSTVGEQDRP